MRVRVLAGALALCLCAFAPASARDNYARQPALDAVHYRLHLELTEAGDAIRAQTEILLAIEADNVRQVALDFGALIVDEVTGDGRAVNFKHDAGRLAVTLPRAYRRGERVRLSVKYHGRPADGLFIKRNKFGDQSVFADNWPDRARHWFPSIDHPSDKATVEFFITAPVKFDVVANGALVETTSRQNGTQLTHWSTTVPIPTYCMVIGATEFSIINAGVGQSTPLVYYLYPKDRANGLKAYARAPQMLKFYTDLIGAYPFEKLALVQSSTRFGGMENSSAIFFDEKAFDGTDRLEGTVAHEIAHQWFGDSVTESDWHHLWLSEGFATYFENLFYERADGRDQFVARMVADKERYMKAGIDSRPIYDPAVTDLFKLLNRNNYEKGGWVLHMLRRVMGDEQFFKGIRDYYRTHRDRTVLTEDFQKVMEIHAGRPLGWFFKQWIYEPGHPVYDAAWRWDERAKQLRLRITQQQTQTIFRMPLDLEIKLPTGTRRETVEAHERTQTFVFQLDAKPQSLRLDPDEWVLKVLKLREE